MVKEIKNEFFNMLFNELVKRHGVTKMTKVSAITCCLSIAGGAIGYLASMKYIPDDSENILKEKENEVC